jgi:nitrate/nitrite transport system permease protein
MALSSPAHSQTPLAKFLASSPATAKILRQVVTAAIALAVLLLLWQLLCSSPDARIPSPSTVVSDTWDLIKDPFFDNGGTDVGLLRHIAASLQRVAIGFTLATIIGVGMGVAIGGSPLIYDALDPIFQVLRCVPPLAWLPLSLQAFQNNQPAAIFVIFVTAVWPVIINTAVGVQQVPSDYKNVSKVLRLSKPEYFTNVLFPATVPYIFTGLRIALGLSWLAIVAAEMLVGGVGIGFFIWDAYNSSMISEIILALVYVGVIGLILDKLMLFVSRFFVAGEQR